MRLEIVCFAALVGCGGGNGAGELVGAFEKGPFVLGSTVDVAVLDASLEPTGQVFRTQTADNAGRFAVVVNTAGTPAVSIEGTGFYYNEITGELSTAPITLRGLAEVGGGAQDAYVNVITHLAYERTRQLVVGGMSIDAASESAEAELRTALHIGPAGFDPATPGLGMTILGGDTDANAYLFAASSVLVQAALERGGPIDAALQELLNTLALDLADDGALTAVNVDALLQAQAMLDPEEVMAGLAVRIAAIGSSAVVPDLNRMIDTDLDGTVNASDNCRFTSNPGQDDADADDRGDACDNCGLVANSGQEDPDGDALGTACDNCPVVANPDQADGNSDGEGNACDTNAELAGLVVSLGVLSPAFAPAVENYDLAMPLLATQTISITATLAVPDATLTVNGVAWTSGVPFGPIAQTDGSVITIAVVAPDAMTARTYTLQVVHGAQTAALATPLSEQFGGALAISGDTLVVGSWQEAGVPAVGGAGAVYVYVRSGTAWVEQARLEASFRDVNDFFGMSVALDGDTLVVGAYHDDSSAAGVDGDESNNASTNSGAAFVFVRSGSTWSQQAYLKASTNGVNDHFGFSVAVSGDTIVVGADREDSSATGVNGNESDNGTQDSGAGYVFHRVGTTWQQDAYLKPITGELYATFGYSVAIDGDTIAIGAREESSHQGAVYMFHRSGGAWTSQGRLASTPSKSFGQTVSVSADTVAVGAPGTSTEAGAVFVFTRSGATWTEQAALTAAVGDPFDHFGGILWLTGDHLAIGAPEEDGAPIHDPLDNSAPLAGAAYLFARTGTTWTDSSYLKATTTVAGDHFGAAVCIDGGVLAVGASSVAGHGAAYIFE